MRFHKKFSIFSGALLIAISSAIDLYAAGPEMPPPTVVVGKVKTRGTTGERRYVGRIKAINETEIPARVSGFLNGITFKEGGMVQKGEKLFEIEDTAYRAKADACRAQLKQCEAEFDYAKTNYERQKGLYEKKAVSAQVHDEALRVYRLAEAKRDESKANLLDAENSLSYTVIYAPISGRIGKAACSPGNYVTPASDPLARIVQIDPIFIKIAISERDYLEMFGSKCNLGEEAEIRLMLSTKQCYPLPGKVILADNRVDNTTGTIMLWTKFSNPDNILIPGGFVTAFLSKKTEKSIASIPLSALLTDKKGTFVYVVDKDGTARRRPVKVGAIIGGWQLIESGLEPDETVIVDGTHKVVPDGKVVPQPEGE